MQALKKKPRRCAGEILWLSPGEILPNPLQPRRELREETLRELAESIRRCGIIQPLSVRARDGCYELIAGERRLRAAGLAGLAEVPCLVLDVDMAESGVIALVENIQRRDLDFVEEAEGISRLLTVFGMTREEAARSLGLSLPAIANKLRLLRLPEDVLSSLRDSGLGERHGRALLRLPEDGARREALAEIIRLGMSAAEADEYVDRLLRAPIAPEPRRGRTKFVLKDFRVFMNTLDRGVELMRRGGIEAQVRRRETEEALIVTVSIPKNGKKQE